MTSVNKLKKAKNAYNNDALKERVGDRMKHVLFYNAKHRKYNKELIRHESNHQD